MRSTVAIRLAHRATRRIAAAGAVTVPLLLAACGTSSPASVPTTTATATSGVSAGSGAGAGAGGAFTYGFDLSTQAPTDSGGNDPAAVTSARSVLSGFAGSYVDQSIWGFGADTSPEPTPGNFDMSAIAGRLHLIESAGGIPVITLVSAPNWMKDQSAGSSGLFRQPPSPDHYADFATLCAHVAASFPEVKYFVVWSELRGFYQAQSKSWDGAAYTAMYNDVYTAIKAVRPDARVGGPYANLASVATPVNGVASSLHGPWGYLDQTMVDALSYWLAHRVGADFVAVDGSTEIAKSDSADLTDAVTASEKYAAVDQWIRSQTDLPIWWMESHIQPTSGWTEQQAAAARVATLVLMAASGARVGMQWQPQQQASWPDEGLWTSTLQPGGGRPTVLAGILPHVLPVLKDPVTIADGGPPGVLMATTASHSIAINTTGATVRVHQGDASVTLAPFAVVVR